MPKLLEYQGKRLLRDCSIPVPEGGVASTPIEAYEIAERLRTTVAVKAQVGVTGRFQAGGIKFAGSADEAKKAAEELLGKEIKGLKVERVLVEEKLPIKGEFYASVIVNDSWRAKGPLLMFSTKGGTGIEEIAVQFPEEVVSMNVDILKGLTIEQTRDLLSKLGVSSPLLEPLSKVVHGLYGVFKKYSARSVEANPIVLTEDDKIYAADCHIVIDEASVFKHPELEIDYPRDIGVQLLHHATVWLCDRYQDGFGLADISADPYEEIVTLFGYPFDFIRIQPRRGSFAASVICDLAAYIADTELYANIVNDIKAASIAPQYWQVPDTTSLFTLDGQDIINYPKIDYSDVHLPFESFSFADHIKHEPRSFGITDHTGPFGPLLIMLLLRDRYFPTLWPLLTN